MAETIHPTDIYVGNQIRLRRLALSISQTDLGISCGVTFQQIQKYERGRNRVSASALYKLSGALHCDPGDLFPPRDGVPPAEVPKILRALGLTPEILSIPDLSPTARKAVATVIAAFLEAEGQPDG